MPSRDQSDYIRRQKYKAIVIGGGQGDIRNRYTDTSSVVAMGNYAGRSFTGRGAIVPDAPLSLTGDISDSMVIITVTDGFDGGSPITGYSYYRSDSSGGSPDIPDSYIDVTNDNPIIIDGLNNGSTITFYIRARNAIGSSKEYAEITLTPVTFPSPPSSLSVIPGDGSVTITFTPGSDGGAPLTDYEYTDDEENWSQIGTTSSPVTISGLTNGIEYTIQLRAVNAVGPSDASSPVTVAPIPDFLPSDIAELNLWLDAHKTESISVIDGTVASWSDRSTNDKTFTRRANTITNEPSSITYAQPSTINGRPAIKFNSIRDIMSSDTFNIAPTNDLSLFMVLKQDTYSGGGNSELFSAERWERFDLFNNTNPPAGIDGQLSLSIGGDGQIATVRAIINPPVNTLVNVVASSDGLVDIYVNGTQTNNNASRQEGYSLNASDIWRLSGNAFIGHIGEVITYPSVLAEDDRQKVEGYLAWKWGMQASLLPGHPYSGIPPASSFPTLSKNILIRLEGSNNKSYSGTGTNWNDLVNNYDGTLVNNVTFNGSKSTFTFNGTNQYVNIPNQLALQINGGNYKTMVAWIKTSSVNLPSGAIFGKQFGGGGDYDGATLVFYGTRGVGLYMNGSSVDKQPTALGYSSSNMVYNYDEWFMATFVICFNGGVSNPSKVFINTTQVISVNHTDGMNYPAAPIRIANSLDGSYGKFSTGAFYYYDGALTSSDITTLYNSTKSRYGL